MATVRELEFINDIRNNGVAENGHDPFISKWEPVGFLGRGAYGEVYLMRRGDEQCAVKIIDMKEDFDYSVEIEALNRIRGQKHAVNIYESEYVNVDRGRYIQKFLIIRMNRLYDLPGTLTEDEALDMGSQLCDILNVCHSGETKIYHCDIKPDNILISGKGEYILSDFGASTISERTHSSSGHAGTPLYMSPEVHDFEAFDGRSDIYSLGITMYALLNNGMPPFYNGDNGGEAIRTRFAGKKLPAIPGVSAETMKILRRMCALEPDKRYRNTQELGSAIDSLREARSKQRAEQERKRRATEEAKRGPAKNDAYAATVQHGRPAETAVTVRRSGPVYAVIAAVVVAAIILGTVVLPKTRTDKNDNMEDASVYTGTAVSDSIPFNIEELSVSDGDAAPGVIDTTESVDNTEQKQDKGLLVGDHVFFGSYPQDKSTPEPIEWKVLAIQNDQVLMITEYLIAQWKYNMKNEAVTWETCTLRKWLNNEFYKAAFSEEEKNGIILRTNDNPDNPSTGTEGGNPTEDYVFCLSLGELQKYMRSHSEILTYGKKTAGDYNSWWLRTPGKTSNTALTVTPQGSYGETYGANVNTHYASLRPAILVSLSAVYDPDSSEDTAAVTEISSETAAGDHVYFGSYPQTEDGGVQPIEWRVLDVQNGKALMISEYLLASRPYENAPKADTDILWETCSLREWMNNDFYNTAFSEEEKSRIALRSNDNSANKYLYYSAGKRMNKTKDHVFCLSDTEAHEYFKGRNKRKAFMTPYLQKQVTDYSLNGSGSWWLRTPGDWRWDSEADITYFAYTILVESNGIIDYYNNRSVSENTCVRPAIQVSLS